MKNKFYKTTFLLLPIWLILVVLFWLAVGVDFDSAIPTIKPCATKSHFELKYHLDKIELSKLYDEFPYERYLDSASWCDIKMVIKDVESIDQFYEAESKGISTIIEALTSKLESRYQLRHTYYNPDGLIEILQWAMSFKQSSDDYNINKIQRIISRYWFNFVSIKLAQFAKEKPRLKYDFKFRYLVALCNSYKYSPSIGNSKFEKVVLNFIDSNFCYMFNRFWNSTGLVFKLIVGLLGLFQLCAYWCVIVVHFRTKRNTINKN